MHAFRFFRFITPTLPFVLASAAFALPNDASYEQESNNNNESLVESIQENVDDINEDAMFEQMSFMLSQTRKQIEHRLFPKWTQSMSNINQINDENERSSADSLQLYDKPLKLDSSFLKSNWNDFYDDIHLLFTEDETVENVSFNNQNMRARMERLVRTTQEHVCYEIEKLENQHLMIDNGRCDQSNIPLMKFSDDLWKRESMKCGRASINAGGLTKVLENGNIFEKAGVSVSITSGVLPASAVKQMSANHSQLKQLLLENDIMNEMKGVQYFAASVSSVLHPWNPHSPTGHFNYRYFELGEINEDTQEFEPKIWWFGGGADLSPAILYEQDCKHFHQNLKNVCKEKYPHFKQWCDEYFVNKHRNNECRGIGGIFFDDLTCDSNEDSSKTREELFAFVRECASVWCLAYLPIARRHAYQRYSLAEKDWQQIRRGRYAEFNLVYDRGTKFGLMKPGARIESILMSMPLTARFEYQRKPKFEFEKEIQDVYENPKQWLS